ncbi:hypothetical protein BJX66DRAFT_209285 [Aspergillus keveii]|uniref:Uncharacterized protein n=1 Tax=Aspergillus keveii TaxID=714993 RepID=A0ABR4GMW8_9EURO
MRIIARPGALYVHLACPSFPIPTALGQNEKLPRRIRFQFRNDLTTFSGRIFSLRLDEVVGHLSHLNFKAAFLISRTFDGAIIRRLQCRLHHRHGIFQGKILAKRMHCSSRQASQFIKMHPLIVIQSSLTPATAYEETSCLFLQVQSTPGRIYLKHNHL